MIDTESGSEGKSVENGLQQLERRDPIEISFDPDQLYAIIDFAEKLREAGITGQQGSGAKEVILKLSPKKESLNETESNENWRIIEDDEEKKELSFKNKERTMPSKDESSQPTNR